MTQLIADEQVADAYDRLAPYYDSFTAGYAYDAWITAIQAHTCALGATGLRALDLACGTGTSTEQLVRRGYDVVACDISERMVEVARRKFVDYADAFLVADMRDLPHLGEFDLIVCLDDAINYLLSEQELGMTFSGVARLLAPGGVFVFDVNSLLTYRTAFAGAMIKEDDGVLLAWQGETGACFQAGAIGTARVEIFAERPDGLWERSSMRHVQRHHEDEVLIAALAAAGLRCVAVLGQHPGARLEPSVDEGRHIKAVYFAQRETSERKG